MMFWKQPTALRPRSGEGLFAESVADHLSATACRRTAVEIEVNQADREAAASGYFAWCSGNPVIPDRMKAGNADDHSMVQAFARHRQAAFADGFSAALQGAEAAIWRIEDDAFLYANVSKALQEVISELQAMERNWTGRATIEHRQAAIKERDAQIERLRRALENIGNLSLNGCIKVNTLHGEWVGTPDAYAREVLGMPWRTEDPDYSNEVMENWSD